MATPGRRITTKEATIKTAAVEVKTLTISGKQVTLAVFRQLQREDLIDPVEVQLRGVPWGLVNYFWGGCREYSHLHVVWQDGDELRRDCINEAECHTARRADQDAIDALTAQRQNTYAAVLLWRLWQQEWSVTCDQEDHDARYCTHTIDVQVQGRRSVSITQHWLTNLLGSDTPTWLHWRYDDAQRPRRKYESRAVFLRATWETGESSEDAQQAARRERDARAAWAQQHLEGLGWTPAACSEDIFRLRILALDEQIEGAEAALQHKLAQWHDLWKSVNSLDQLFIAV
jgi:hypothetical protein